jgi:hypothetical protein
MKRPLIIRIAVAVLLTLSPAAFARDDWHDGGSRRHDRHDPWRHNDRWRFGYGDPIYPYDGEPVYPYVTPPVIVDPPPFQPPWVDPPPFQSPSADPPPFLYPGW